MHLFGLPMEYLVGPASGLVISLVFAFQMKMDNGRSLQMFQETNERLISAFEEEVRACEKRYEIVLEEVFKLKNNG
jgi:hypothetical protein